IIPPARSLASPARIRAAEGDGGVALLGGQHSQNRRRVARGQALVEFAFVAPVLVLLLASLVQFGLIFERQIGINNAAREAARRGAALATTSANAATNSTWTLNELQTALANAQGYTDGQKRNLQVC